MTLTIEEILGRVELPEESVPLCLRGSLVAEYERLEQELATAPTAQASLADIPVAIDIAQRMEALRQEMLADTAEFRLRALGGRAWSDFMATQPERSKEQSDDEWSGVWHAWVCGLVATTCYSPAMTGEQVDALSQKLSGAQWTRLSNAAYAVNGELRSIPFSAAASAVLLATGARSRQPETSESPDLGSLAGSPEPSPSTSTTTLDA